MRFSRIIGKDLKDDAALIKKAEEKLSKVFMNLAVKYDNKNVGDGWGGDPLIFTLMQPVDHVASRNIKTAATDGKVFYWDPRFVLKQDEKGLRIVAAHEAFHALYLHPSRRGSRNPRLWNIAVDYIVNGQVMDDFKTRNLDPKEMFTKHLGKYMGLKEYIEFLKNPFKKKTGFEAETDTSTKKGKKNKKVKMPAPDEDRDLTPEEIEELEKEESRAKFYFADPDIEHDMKRPERIYDLLVENIPKCPECGRLGVYPKQKNDQGGQDQDQNGKKETKKSKGKKDGNDGSGGKNPGQKGQKGKNKGDGAGDPNDDHEHGEDGSPCDHNCDHGNQPGDQNGDGQGEGNDQGQGQSQGSCDHEGHGCGSCGGDGGFDVFDFGGLVDDHMDARESEEKLAKRFAEAIEAAKKMAGHIPAGLEDELGILTAPKISWTDVIRGQFRRTREGNERSDWTRYKARPLSAGMLVPKRKTYTVNAGVLLDTSGSMSIDDRALGISQLQSLDERNEITLCCADVGVYWDQALKIRKFTADHLQGIKTVGNGGTVWGEFFSDYEQHIGKCDFLIIMSDLYLGDDQATWVDPGIPVYFLCTSGNTSFVPPFGKVLQLH